MKLLRKLGLLLGGITALLIPQAKGANLGLKDGVFDGATYDAYYGPVQVEVTIQGGRIVAANALQYPNHRRTSVDINRQALPYLQREVVQAQSARVNAISGATLTSRAYIGSVADALQQASK